MRSHRQGFDGSPRSRPGSPRNLAGGVRHHCPTPPFPVRQVLAALPRPPAVASDRQLDVRNLRTVASNPRRARSRLRPLRAAVSASAAARHEVRTDVLSVSSPAANDEPFDIETHARPTESGDRVRRDRIRTTSRERSPHPHEVAGIFPEVRCLSAKSTRAIVTSIYLIDAIRSQGFSPSQRFDPARAVWPCFVPHPLIGFLDGLQSFSHRRQPWRLSTLNALLTSGLSDSRGSTRTTQHTEVCRVRVHRPRLQSFAPTRCPTLRSTD
jgi:hypothetical protein